MRNRLMSHMPSDRCGIVVITAANHSIFQSSVENGAKKLMVFATQPEILKDNPCEITAHPINHTCAHILQATNPWSCGVCDEESDENHYFFRKLVVLRE
jgi:hypothetical protein